MAVKRLEHIGVVVDDLPAAVAFFIALGLEVEGEGSVAGDWVDRIIGLDGASSDLVILRTPDGHSKVELTKFHAPPSPAGDERPPSNAPGIRHLLFAVDDLRATVARLEAHGGELVGTIEPYRDVYLLCYLRGPAGIIIELAEELR